MLILLAQSHSIKQLLSLAYKLQTVFHSTEYFQCSNIVIYNPQTCQNRAHRILLFFFLPLNYCNNFHNTYFAISRGQSQEHTARVSGEKACKSIRCKLSIRLSEYTRCLYNITHECWLCMLSIFSFSWRNYASCISGSDCR